jgi:hypothetical protein
VTRLNGCQWAFSLAAWAIVVRLVQTDGDVAKFPDIISETVELTLDRPQFGMLQVSAQSFQRRRSCAIWRLRYRASRKQNYGGNENQIQLPALPRRNAPDNFQFFIMSVNCRNK